MPNTEKITLTTGDLVRLKSDGPVMTVIYYDSTSFYSVRCIWFNPSTASYNVHDFVPDALDKLD